MRSVARLQAVRELLRDSERLGLVLHPIAADELLLRSRSSACAVARVRRMQDDLRRRTPRFG
jgi:hypothetical protein